MHDVVICQHIEKQITQIYLCNKPLRYKRVCALHGISPQEEHRGPRALALLPLRYTQRKMDRQWRQLWFYWLDWYTHQIYGELLGVRSQMLCWSEYGRVKRLHKIITMRRHVDELTRSNTFYQETQQKDQYDGQPSNLELFQISFPKSTSFPLSFPEAFFEAWQLLSRKTLQCWDPGPAPGQFYERCSDPWQRLTEIVGVTGINLSLATLSLLVEGNRRFMFAPTPGKQGNLVAVSYSMHMIFNEKKSRNTWHKECMSSSYDHIML